MLRAGARAESPDMSRQMAFQMTGPQLRETLKKVLLLRDIDRGLTLEQWIAAQVEDEKEREQLVAAFIVADKYVKTGRRLEDIAKVIAWRGPDGKAKDLQIEFSAPTGFRRC